MLWSTSILCLKFLKIVQKLLGLVLKFITTRLTQDDFLAPPSSQVCPSQSLIHQCQHVKRYKEMKLTIMPTSMLLPPFSNGLIIYNIFATDAHDPIHTMVFLSNKQNVVQGMQVRVWFGMQWKTSLKLIIDHAFKS